jgi:3-deoxy-D-manno-octulosonic-acid transferase
VYDLLISAYHLALRIAAFRNAKARLWVDGRKGLLERVEREVAPHDGPTVWVHCASLGEFEMARPIIEGIRAMGQGHRIILTFFSPSGYEVRKDFSGAEHVFYLPLDTEANAQQFVGAIRPDVVVFVKYDLWRHFLEAAKGFGARLFLISAVFEKRQYFFKWYGGHGRACLALFDRIFTVDDASVQLLNGIGINNAEACGDTRYDRVMALVRTWEPIPEVVRFKGDEQLVVCGSTWPEDEAALRATVGKLEGVRWVLAPHEVDEANLKRIEGVFPEAVRLSRYRGQSATMLLVDSIGLLGRLYGHADVAYVGGAFGRRLHNILEVTAYGIPVVFGPDHGHLPDAGQMLQLGLATSVADAQQMTDALRNHLGGPARKEAMLAFMHERTGATEVILSHLC